MMLDLESVRLFVLVAEHANLTRAAQAAGTVQPVVSQRLKGLEAALGVKLLERTPRFVRLTPAGAGFLARARRLLAAHEEARDFGPAPAPHVALGVSDHALGASFDVVLRRLRAALPDRASFSLRLGQSLDIRDAFEAGALDLAVVRREGGGPEETLGVDPLSWRAARGWTPPEGPLPLALLPAPCGVRAVAVKALDRAGWAWREAFVAGACLALLSAARAGLGVAPLGRAVGADLVDCGAALGLPPLPASEIVLLARTGEPHLAAAARALAASVRESLR